jgi:MFS family permease
MRAGLYDAAFATLARLYGQQARTAITTLTLFGGFASTVCWPLSALFVSHFGWRNTYLIYAGIHLAVLLSLYVFALPKAPKRTAFVVPHAANDGGDRADKSVRAGEQLLFALIALVITISSMISALLSVTPSWHAAPEIDEPDLVVRLPPGAFRRIYSGSVRAFGSSSRDAGEHATLFLSLAGALRRWNFLLFLF